MSKKHQKNDQSISRELLSSGDKSLSEIKGQDTLDKFLLQNIGVGKAQSRMMTSINILLFTEGAQSIAIGFLLPELQREWQISVFQKSLLITAVYIGVSIGSFLESYVDQYGRSAFIKWNAVLQTVFGVLSCFSTSMIMFVCFRFVYGIGIGIILPLSATYQSQISLNQNRAQAMMNCLRTWSIGCLVTCAMAWALLLYNHWRILLFMICIPGMYAFYFHQKQGKESIRYLWSKGRSNQAYQVLKYMAKYNQKPPISKQEVDELMKQKQQCSFSNVFENSSQSQFSQLLSTKYKKITILLSIAWLSVCFIFYGVLLLLPTIIEKEVTENHLNVSNHYKFAFLLIVSTVEVLCYDLSAKIMDYPAFGRKKSLYYLFYTTAFLSAIVLFIGPNHQYCLMGAFTFIKVSNTCAFLILYSYTAEIYQTLLRGKAMGLMSLIGRIATAALGLTGVSSLYWFNGNGLYLLFIALGLAAGYSIYKMPFCTFGKGFDT